MYDLKKRKKDYRKQLPEHDDDNANESIFCTVIVCVNAPTRLSLHTISYFVIPYKQIGTNDISNTTAHEIDVAYG